MADSIILTTARTYEAELWTQDADFEGTDGVRYIRKVGDEPGGAASQAHARGPAFLNPQS
jgi:hypothetical protein